MNVFNRIIMVLLIVLGLALVVAILLNPLYSADLVRSNVNYFAESILGDQFFMWFVGVMAAVSLVLLIILWLELRRPRKKTVRIKTQKGGLARLGVRSVEQSLEYRIDELAGVRKVQPKVISRGKDVEVRIDLDTSPSVNIAVLTDQIVGLCRDIVAGQLGVKIRGKVQVNVKHEPYPRGTMPPTGPLVAEAIAAPPQMAVNTAVPSPTVAVAPEPVDLGSVLDQVDDVVDEDRPYAGDTSTSSQSLPE